MDEKRKLGWPYWTTSTLLIVATYVASIGPALWLLIKAGYPANGASLFRLIYAPLRLLNLYEIAENAHFLILLSR